MSEGVVFVVVALSIMVFSVVLAVRGQAQRKDARTVQDFIEQDIKESVRKVEDIKKELSVGLYVPGIDLGYTDSATPVDYGPASSTPMEFDPFYLRPSVTYRELPVKETHVNCAHCGQRTYVDAPCEHCGAPVNP